MVSMLNVITRSLAAVAAAGIVLVPVPASAAEVGASGWWTAVAPLAMAPDAEDALVVQGGVQVDPPLSYAAVEFALDEEESVSRLRLTVSAGSVTTSSATLTVCPLTSPLTPADGGSMASGPDYDCTTKASATATAGVYRFDVASLTTARTLALAILPGAASDRVVLAKPGADALETSGGGPATGGDAPAGTVGTGGSVGSAGDPGFSSTPSPPVGRFDAPANDPPAVGEAAAAPRASADEPAVAISTAPARTSGANSGPPVAPIAPIAFVLLALLGAGLWTTAGRMADDQRDLTTSFEGGVSA